MINRRFNRKRYFVLTVLLIGVVHVGVIRPASGEFFTFTDPTGDVTGTHDIERIEGAFDFTHLFLNATFETGTLDVGNLGFIFGLDIDEDASTGLQPTSFPVGADFTVFFNALGDPNQAGVFNTSTLQTVGNVSVNFAPDAFSLSVPLSLLGDDDGRMNIGLVSGDPTDGTSFQALDTAPDNIRIGPLVGPTTFVPEPASYLMFFAMLISVFVLRGKTKTKKGHESSFSPR